MKDERGVFLGPSGPRSRPGACCSGVGGVRGGGPASAGWSPVADRAAQVQHAPRREVRPVGPTCIKQLVNAELGLKPTPKSRFLITTLCWGTFASSHMVSSRDEVVYNQESVLGSQGLWKATMEPVLLERI